jgi:hypothetical protein
MKQPSIVSSLHKQQERYNRFGLMIVSCLYIFLYIGAFFGWGQMQLILEHNDSFSSLCNHNTTMSGIDYDGETDTSIYTNETSTNLLSNNTDTVEPMTVVCKEQTNALIRVQLIAQTIQIASPLYGYIIDRYGAKFGYYILTSNIWCGLIILVICTILSNPIRGTNILIDRLLYLVFILLSIGVSFGGILMIQTGIFYQSRTQQRAISILNTLLDAGAITYLILYQISYHNIASITTIFSTYLGLSILLLGSGIYFWNVAVPEGIDHESIVSDHVSSIVVVNKNENHRPNTTVDIQSTQIRTNEDDRTTHINATTTTSIVDVDMIPLKKEKVDESKKVTCYDALDHITEPHDGYILIANRTRLQQLICSPSLCLMIFVGIHTTSNQWTLATIRDYLASLGDDNYNNKYLTIFTLLTPVSILGLPFIDYIFHYHGYHMALQCTNMLGIGYMLVRLCSTNLNVQIIGFIIFAIFRCFLYSTFQSLLPTLFSSDVVGLMTGILIGIPGITAFLNIPLAKYTIQTADGNFFVANLLYTLLVIPCIIAAYCIGQSIQREKHIQNKTTNASVR